MKKRPKIKKFKLEDQEREFWSKFDLSKYFEEDDFESPSRKTAGLQHETPLNGV